MFFNLLDWYRRVPQKPSIKDIQAFGGVFDLITIYLTSKTFKLFES